jgi:hypothetical protein
MVKTAHFFVLLSADVAANASRSLFTLGVPAQGAHQ